MWARCLSSCNRQQKSSLCSEGILKSNSPDQLLHTCFWRELNCPGTPVTALTTCPVTILVTCKHPHKQSGFESHPTSCNQFRIIKIRPILNKTEIRNLHRWPPPEQVSFTEQHSDGRYSKTNLLESRILCPNKYDIWWIQCKIKTTKKGLRIKLIKAICYPQ